MTPPDRSRNDLLAEIKKLRDQWRQAAREAEFFLPALTLLHCAADLDRLVSDEHG